MANVLRDQGKFFNIPAEFVESGGLRDMSPSSVKLYVALYYFAQKHSAVRLEFSSAELQDHTGLDTKSIQSARGQLRDRRLIEIQKGALGVYTYILLNPATGSPLPAPEKRTGLRRYHGRPKDQSKQQPGTKSPVPQKKPIQTATGCEVGGQRTAASGFRCFTCKGTEYWSRAGTDRICAHCHPDPRGSIPQREIRSPTAAEMGF